MTDDRSSGRALKVAALVDLLWNPNAGGHVKCWERLAEAATAHSRDLDLTVHFEGEREARHVLASNVRYQFHRPVLSTARLPFLSHVPDHTDLAPWQPRLARRLGDCAVIHTTDAYFAFAATAERIAARRGLPLIHSIHTDTPSYTRVFTAETIERLAGSGLLAHLLSDRLHLPEKGERSMLRRLARHQSLCRFVLASRPEDLNRAAAVVDPGRVRRLRRGIDHRRFTPDRRNRELLHRRFGVPLDAVVILFAGRINRGKNVLVLAEAVRLLAEEGLAAHLLCVGDGEDRDRVTALLGPAATCPGALEQDDLARVYASADVFALPSLIEIHSNVVQEALSSGLPVVMAAAAGLHPLFGDGRSSVVAAGADPPSWARALRPLVADRHLATVMGRAARKFAETRLPSWDQVLVEDLLPVWSEAAGTDARTAPSSPCWRHAS